MIEISQHMRILVAVEPVDFRRRIDGLSQLVRSVLQADPFDGTVFVFRSRAGRDIALLTYDGQGFVLCQKRLSAGTFRFWPSATTHPSACRLFAHQLRSLIWGGDPTSGYIAPMWRRVDTPEFDSIPDSSGSTTH